MEETSQESTHKPATSSLLHHPELDSKIQEQISLGILNGEIFWQRHILENGFLADYEEKNESKPLTFEVQKIALF